jgi:hypothetical protein
MPVQIPQQDAQRALQALGVTSVELNGIRAAPFPQAQIMMAELKVKAKRAYKRFALELHPDRTGGDQEKTDFFVLLGHVLAEFEKATVQPPPPRIPVPAPMQWANVHWVNTAAATTATTTRTIILDQQQRVIRIVQMRPK